MVSHTRDLRFVAYKRAYLCLDPATGELWFRAHVASDVYGVFGEAFCRMGHDHQAPAPDCSCGFYGLSDRGKAAGLKFSGALFAEVVGSSALLAVSLYGTVVEGSQGFRASRQRVDFLELNGRCLFCSRPAAAVLPTRTFYSASGSKELRFCDSLCALHLSKAKYPDDPLSPAEVSGRLGVDVRWGTHTSVDDVLLGRIPGADDRARGWTSALVRLLGLAAEQ